MLTGYKGKVSLAPSSLAPPSSPPVLPVRYRPSDVDREARCSSGVTESPDASRRRRSSSLARARSRSTTTTVRWPHCCCWPTSSPDRRLRPRRLRRRRRRPRHGRRRLSPRWTTATSSAISNPPTTSTSPPTPSLLGPELDTADGQTEDRSSTGDSLSLLLDAPTTTTAATTILPASRRTAPRMTAHRPSAGRPSGGRATGRSRSGTGSRLPRRQSPTARPPPPSSTPPPRPPRTGHRSLPSPTTNSRLHGSSVRSPPVPCSRVPSPVSTPATSSLPRFQSLSASAPSPSTSGKTSVMASREGTGTTIRPRWTDGPG